MKRSAWFLVSAAVVVILSLCLTLSCGHKGNGADTAVGAGSKPAHQMTDNGAARAGLEPAPTLDSILRDIDAYPVPKGMSAQTWATLTAELKRLLIARGAGSKTLSNAPTGRENAVTNLAAYSDSGGTRATLTWTDKLAGDTNNDGVVNVDDLQPIALWYGYFTVGTPITPPPLADANGDGRVDITDLQPVAANYGMHIQGYQVWRGHWNGTTTDWETTFLPNVGDHANTAFSSDRTASPPSTVRPTYTYVDDINGVTDKAGLRYKVTAYGDGAAGAESDVCTPVTVALDDSPWPKFGGDIGNTELSQYRAVQSATLKWSRVIGANLTSSPVIGTDGTVYIGTGEQFYSLNPLDGSLRWSATLAGDIVSTPAIGSVGGSEVVYVPAGCYLYALNGADGTERWSNFDNASFSSVTLGADGTAYAANVSRYVCAVNPLDGNVQWSSTISECVWYTCPALGQDGTVYVTGGATLYAVDASEGRLKWTFGAADLITSPAIGVDGTVYIGSDDRNVYAVDPTNGTLKWTHGTYGLVQNSPAIGPDGTVYLGSSDCSFCALSPTNGAVKWTFTAASPFWSGAPVIGDDGTVYTASDTDMYALSTTDGSVKWSYPIHGSTYDAPAIGADGTVYIGTYDGTLYAFGP